VLVNRGNSSSARHNKISHQTDQSVTVINVTQAELNGVASQPNSISFCYGVSGYISGLQITSRLEALTDLENHHANRSGSA
jgi:hypothetical protein